MMRGRLNIFQRTALLWNEMHPYNAIHVVKLKHLLEPERLKGDIDRVLERHGLVNIVIDGTKKTYDYRGGRSDVGMDVIRGDDPPSALHSEIRRQLNLPFAATGTITPFRFFVIPDGDGFYLGLVYLHLIAGADSVIALIKDIVSSHAGGKTPEISPPFVLYPAVYRKLMPFSLRHLAWWALTFPEHISHTRTSFRPRYRDSNDTGTGFACLSISPTQFQAIIRSSKSWEVTVNDLFLAVLLKSLAPLASKRLQAVRRSHVSVASIVNIRKDLSVGADTFGLFLSYFNVTHPVPGGIGLARLARDVRRQTEKIKKHKLFLRTVLEMWAALMLVSGLFKDRKKSFYAKYNPIWGGITNVNLNTIWPASDGDIPAYYLRAVSTGNATPLVFSFTTINDMITVGISYRQTVFSEADIENVLANFSNCMSEIDEGV